MKAAILIVNGGGDPPEGKWIRFCVMKVLENTEYDNYHLYVWNNNIDDIEAVNFLDTRDNVTLIQANSDEKLLHPHAVPLQRLYETAYKDKPNYIITLDSDAHPIKKGWLCELISELNETVVISGIWRDELSDKIAPYIHPSCLCTTIDFIEENQLKLDYIAPNTTHKINDTLSVFTETAMKLNLKVFKLRRSNKRNFHRIMGGIYGDLIYHHGAGSREKISFWDEGFDKSRSLKYNKISSYSSTLLFNDYSNFIGWLLGSKTRYNPIDKILELT